MNCGATALHRACQFGEEETVKFLLEKGADINCGDLNGDTPLHEACYSENANIVDILLKNNCDVERFGRRYTPIFAAVSMLDLDIARMLIEKGASLNTSSEEVEGIMSFLIRKRSSCGSTVEMAKLLMKHGAKVPERIRENISIITARRELELEEEEKKKLRRNLLLCTRKFCPESPFYEETLPLDIFKVLFVESDIIGRIQDVSLFIKAEEMEKEIE